MSAPSGMNENSMIRGVELRLDALILGLNSSVPASVTSLVVGGVTMPIAEVLKKAHEAEKPWKDARAAHATIRAVAQSRPKDEEVAVGFLNDVKVGLVAALGRESQKLTDFGFKPQKRREALTSEEKILRAAKAKLTREKRHTMGSRQKAEIKATETPTIRIGPDGVKIDPPSTNSSTRAV